LTLFATVTDRSLAEIIRQSTRRVVYLAPGVGVATAEALVGWNKGELSVILDADPDVCRIGFGDLAGLEIVAKAISSGTLKVRRQAGLRIGILIADERIVVWSPTPQAVEEAPAEGQPNGLCLSGTGDHELGALVRASSQISDGVLDAQTATATVEELRSNPPAPFDLSQRARVFSTRFQFVECEVRGAEWTERRVKLSSLLLNADLPESIQDILETQVRPFQAQGEVELSVPGFLNGEPAFDAAGKRILVKMRQSEILKQWTDIRARYLRHVPSFGSLIRRDMVTAFKEDVRRFEEVLMAWVDSFKKHVEQTRDAQVDALAAAITHRIPSNRRAGPVRIEETVKREVAAGL
jgi:hypothetical protein